MQPPTLPTTRDLSALATALVWTGTGCAVAFRLLIVRARHRLVKARENLLAALRSFRSVNPDKPAPRPRTGRCRKAMSDPKKEEHHHERSPHDPQTHDHHHRAPAVGTGHHRHRRTGRHHPRRGWLLTVAQVTRLLDAWRNAPTGNDTDVIREWACTQSGVFITALCMVGEVGLSV